MVVWFVVFGVVEFVWSSRSEVAVRSTVVFEILVQVDMFEGFATFIFPTFFSLIHDNEC